jgi:hypothetical protein
MAKHWFRRNTPAAGDGPERATEALEAAQRSLDEARAAHRRQTQLRDAEREQLIARMERLARENHLGALVWDVVTGNGERK